MPTRQNFYDIYCIVTERAIDLCEAENLELVRAIFDAKFVPFELFHILQGDSRFSCRRLARCATVGLYRLKVSNLF